MRPSDVLVVSTGIGHTLLQQHTISGIESLPETIPEPLSIPIVGKDEERGPEFQRSKARFFFKLERELEKVRLIPCPLSNVRSLIDADKICANLFRSTHFTCRRRKNSSFV